MTSERTKIIIATVLGFGMILLATIVSIQAQWVVDGQSGDTRLGTQYIYVLGFLVGGMVLLGMTFLIYLDRDGNRRRDVDGLKKRLKSRAVLGGLSIVALIASMMSVPYIDDRIDIGGVELPSSESWKPFAALWGFLIVFSVACFLSVGFSALERMERMEVD